MNRDRYRRPTGPLSVETTGKTVDEAVHAALARLRARRDEVEVTVLQEGRGGFLGLGSKEARVRVRKRETSAPRPGGERGGRREDDESDRSAGRMGTRRGREDVDRLAEELRVRRDQRRSGVTGRGRDMGPSHPPQSSVRGRATPSDSPYEAEARRGGSDRRGHGSRRGGGRGSRERGSGRMGMAAESRPPRADGPRAERPRAHPESPRPVPRDLPDAAVLAQFTQELLGKMGFAARVEAAYEDDAYEVRIEAGEDDAILIGRKGETLDALQHVLAKMVSRGHEELLRVRVDVSEYRQRRSSELAERALEMAQQVRDTGTEVITEPLPAAERRVIHRTLSELPDITTQALGDGLIKRVWIGPQGGQPPAAESETAREQETPEPRFVREERETIAERAAMAEGAEEPLSLIDPWNAPAKPGAEGGGTVEEWGRRPKPARGRRR